MIIKFRERYSEIAKKNNLDEELIESIADTVFSQAKNRLENFNEIQYDIPGLGSWILREHKFDTVVNIGAMAGVRNSLNNPEIYIKTNTEGQIHLLKECVETKVKHFVYASSSSVYGKNKKTRYTFCNPDYCHPNKNVYSQSNLLLLKRANNLVYHPCKNYINTDNTWLELNNVTNLVSNFSP